MTPKQEAAMVFREIKVGEYVLRFWPSDNGWMCGITPEMMQALTEPKEKYQYGTPLLDAMTGKTEQPANVADVNTSSERVDKTAKNVHEQPAQQECNHCGGTGDVSGEYPGVACPKCNGSGVQAQPEFIKHEVENTYDWSEWVCPDHESYLMKCCDCGLVHEAQFRVAKYQPSPSDECEVVNDSDLLAQFRMRRSEQWSPKDMAYRPGGLPLVEEPAQQQINCKHKRENNGVCPHHNLHCGWPKCNEPAQQQKEGFASPGGGYVPAIPRPIPLDWKLVPRKATPEMLRAMDECAQEGYDERLYEGMASSVYMAAWDASPVMGSFPTSNTFKEWFYSKPHRAKYSSNHPAYLAAQEAWEAAHEACAKVCDEKVDAEYATGKVDHNEMGWTQACAIAIRARRKE